jgi:hypothetical protein
MIIPYSGTFDVLLGAAGCKPRLRKVEGNTRDREDRVGGHRVIERRDLGDAVFQRLDVMERGLDGPVLGEGPADIGVQ